MTRFSVPLSNDVKLTAPALKAMVPCLNEMAVHQGISRSELIRRILASAIVDDAPAQLAKVSMRSRSEIESLAHLR